jgi:hypothetical protein
VTRLVRAELLKLRTTPGPWIVLGVTLLFTCLGVVAAFLVTGNGPNASTRFVAPHTVHRLRLLLGAGFAVGGVWMAAVVGVLSVTTEYRHKVMTTTLLVTPQRARLLVGKGIVSVIWGVLLGLASLVVVAAFGIPLLAAEGGSLSALLRQVGPVVPGLLGAFALLALFGVGFGVLVKNQVGAILSVLVLSIILEPILDGLLPSVGRWLPSAASQAVAGGLAARNDLSLLSWWLGALVLIAWGVVPAVIGYFVSFRRDVT